MLFLTGRCLVPFGGKTVFESYLPFKFAFSDLKSFFIWCEDVHIGW